MHKGKLAESGSSVAETWSNAVSSFANRISFSSIVQRSNGYEDPNRTKEENEFEEEYCWTTLDRSGASNRPMSPRERELSSPELFKQMLENVKKAEKEMDEFIVQKRKAQLQRDKDHQKFEKLEFKSEDMPWLNTIKSPQFSDLKHNLRRYLTFGAEREEQQLIEEAPDIKTVFS
jgi:hypothetical protein